MGVYKRFRRGKEDKNYTIGFNDNGKWREIAGTPDKRTSEQLFTQLKAKAILQRQGAISPEADPIVAKEREPVERHISDYICYLEGKGDSDKYVAQRDSYLQMVCEACGFKTIGDIDATKVMSHVAELRRQGKGPAAINRRLSSIKGFAKWLFENERARKHRLVLVKPVNARIDRRHPRRILSDEELAKVLAAAESSGQRVMGLTGPERAMYYRIALGTGFRAAEIASLTPMSFNLTDMDNASVTVAAAYSKHRREDVQPILRELAERVQTFIDGKPLDKPIFKKPDKPVEMLKVDLATAGIPYKNTAGEYCDFHALRHTFISRLARAGVSPAVAKELARHSTIDLTINHYTHVKDEQRAALAKLPPVA